MLGLAQAKSLVYVVLVLVLSQRHVEEVEEGTPGPHHPQEVEAVPPQDRWASLASFWAELWSTALKHQNFLSCSH